MVINAWWGEGWWPIRMSWNNDGDSYRPTNWLQPIIILWKLLPAKDCSTQRMLNRSNDDFSKTNTNLIVYITKMSEIKDKYDINKTNSFENILGAFSFSVWFHLIWSLLQSVCQHRWLIYQKCFGFGSCLKILEYKYPNIGTFSILPTTTNETNRNVMHCNNMKWNAIQCKCSKRWSENIQEWFSIVLIASVGCP